MIQQSADGKSRVIRNDESSPRHLDVSLIRRSFALMLKQQKVPPGKAAEILGVHRNTYRTMISQVPKPLGVVFGSGEWTPECQDQDPATCTRCGGDNGQIKRGSRLYCAACHRTGFEKRIENERINDIFNEAISAECEAQERKAELAQRRKNRKK